MADEQNKDTGKYIDILNIFANKENLDGSEHSDTSGMKTQFTAEEFNGIVRALRELYQATSDKEFWVNEFVDLSTGDTSVRNATIKKGNPFSLEFNYISKYRKGFGSYIISNSDTAHFTISYKKSGSSVAPKEIYNSRDVDGEAKPMSSNTSFSLDISKFLESGGKYEFTVSGENVTEGYKGDTTFVLYYYITVTDMSLEFQNETWWLTPFVYGENGATTFSVSFRVGGSGNRKVILTTSGQGVTSKEYVQSVDAGAATVSFNVEMPANRNTIMNVSAKMQNADDTSVETDPINRNCMILKAANQSGIKLFAVNEFKSKVKGGQAHKLFSYAVYDSNSTDDYTDLVFTTKIEKSGEVTTETKSERVALKTRHEFEIDLSSVETDEPEYKLRVGVKDAANKVLMSDTDQKYLVTVDNSSSFSPISNAIWYMNPSGRKNSENRREEIKNNTDNTYVTATWNNFAWSSGDGWVSSSEVDENGNAYTLSSLRVLSGSSVNINYQPLNMGALGMRTIEIDYKISAISDDTLPAIVITQNDKAGIKIYPNRICTGTTSIGSDLQREIATDDSVRIRATITLSRGESVLEGKTSNFIRIFIDGILAKIYEIGDNESMNNAGNIIIGSTGCDIDVYGIRVYSDALTYSGIVKNYINRLNTTAQKEFVVNDNRVFEGEQDNNWMGSGVVDFKNTVDQYNVFVFDGDVWPNYNNQNKSKGNLELYSVNNIGGIATPDGTGQSWKISNVEVKGQGTSSMSYYEWNLQFKTADNSEYWPLVKDEQGNWYDDKGDIVEGETHGRIDKDGEPVLGEDGQQIMDPVYSNVTYDKKIPMFNGVPKANAIVMKKNWASSMQDHKIGSVNSYTAAWKSLGLSNAATTADSKVRVSVYQEPMLGFHKKTTATGEVIYEYKGLFTGGPHKGDKQCFGYNNKESKGGWADLISLEGASNGFVFAEFSVPWKVGDDHVSYDAKAEGVAYDSEAHWDFNFGAYDSDDTDHVAEILDQVNRTFHDAYNIVYECNQNLYPFDGTEEEFFAAVNAKEVIQSRDYWLTSTYELYHVFEEKGKRPVEKVDTGNGPINLLTQLGDIKYDYSFTKSPGARIYNEGTTTVTEGIAAATTPEEKNEIFKKARIVRFRKEAGKYWDLKDAIFHHCWIEFFAGSDQRTKNTYPYSYQTKDENGNLTQDGKWKWRMDDADTIGPIDNSGVITKKYSTEVHDLDEKGSPLFNGQNNCFWNLIETLEDTYYQVMSELLQAMVNLSGASGSVCNQIYNFYSKYFLAVKKYFPEVMYNQDAVRYEKAFQSGYPKADMALKQSLGNAYSPESAWYKKRIDYITSKYTFGDYKNGSVQNTFVHRVAKNALTNGKIDLDLVLGMDLYPTAELDVSMIKCNDRHFAGIPFKMSGTVSDADVDFRIHGAKYYVDLGDLHTINFSDNSTVNFTPFTSIKELNLGWPDASQIVSKAKAINVPTSLRKIYLENCSEMNSIVGLDRCISLKEINALGTNIAYFNFANGAPIESIKYPSTVENLQFLNCSFLKEENIVFNGQENISTIYINNTPGVPAIKIISDIIEAQSKLSLKPLKYLNIQGVDETFVGQDSVKVLELLNNITDLNNGFKGVNSLGQADDAAKPVITGKIGVEFSYEDTEKALEAFFPGLNISVSIYYIRFADENVKKMMKTFMQNLGHITATEEITTENAKEVVSLKAGNAAGIFREVGITSFDELKYFTNYTVVDSFSGSQTGYVPYGDFENCVELKSIALDNITSIRNSGFKNSGLESVEAPKLESIEAEAFLGCTNLVQVDFSKSSLKELKNAVFSGCSALKVCKLPDTLTSIGNNVFNGASSLTEITIPNNCASIGDDAFAGSGVTTIFWNWTGAGAPTLPSNTNAAFGTKIEQIYMPKSFIDNASLYGAWKNYLNLLVPYDFK